MAAKTDDQPSGPVKNLSVWAISGEIGLKLALPLLVLMLGGIKLDKANGTTPLFTFIGIALALTASITMIARMIRRVNRQDQ
ncbi:AtpZ/AtpI family protein [Candidatus Parcubacteria bacterium]|nr:AtpZ/AtpI family protein [Candidatus Parcubacteria bacterium]